VERHCCIRFLPEALDVVYALLTLYIAVFFFTSQYHRSMREFTVAVRHMAAQVVTEDEIANAAGNLSY
jgi:hypothetical protein